MRIGLIGFCFVNANMGCEALSYSFIKIVKECIADKKLEVCLFEEKEDLGDFPEYFPDVQFDSCHIRLKDPKGLTYKKLKSCDYIFDITYGDGFSDIYYKKYAIKTIAVKKMALLTKKPFILLPQTYGPFSTRWIEKAAMHIIKKSPYVYSRDQLSRQYIQRKIKRDVKTFTDLAFYLPYKAQNFCTDKQHIGINISGLLYKGGFHSDNQFGLKVDYKKYIHKLIVALLEDEKNEVHIIPHVIESIPGSNDGDIEACNIIKKMFPDVTLAPVYTSPIFIKNYIAGMNVFTGARMHSTVAAFSSGVATIPFAYSRKFKGLYENLNYSYCIEAVELDTASAVSQTLEYISKKNLLEKEVEQSMITVNQQLAEFKDEILEILDNKYSEK